MRRGWLASLLLLWLPPALAAAQPAVELHQLRWFVHVDLIDAGAGQDLAYYEARLADALVAANDRVRGDQGPYEEACCSEIETLSVATFGTPGDGLDSLDSQAEFDALAAIGLPGRRAFLVQDITYCGAPGIFLGCANQAPCVGAPSDLVMAVAEGANLPFVIAHEVGHLACLLHDYSEPCLLMNDAGTAGGCLSAGECQAFRDAGNASGPACACFAPSGQALADGESCVEPDVAGFCSGGFCGSLSSEAAIQHWAAGGPEATFGAIPDDALLLGGLLGGWSDQGPIGAGAEPRGLAFAPARGVLYAVGPGAGDDELHALDPTTGARTGSVGVVTGYQHLTGLAFDSGPGASPADDRLLAVATDGSCDGDLGTPCPGVLLAIDPDSATPTLLGTLAGALGGWQGLAWDDASDRLYVSGLAEGGVWEIDPACPAGVCSESQASPYPIVDELASLTWSPVTGRLYQVGSYDQIMYYDVIEPADFSGYTIDFIQGFSAGGLAAVPVPEPAGPAPLVAAALLLAVLARRRARARSTGSP